ncbi:MAG: hypothetical protein H7Y61_06300 [Rhizobiales bacterium]|nr:hypothetical protein [Rhizobacter sp.]
MIDDLKSQLGSSMQTMRRFLQRPISVKQGTLTLGVPAGSARAQAREEERQRVRRMRRDLYELMQQHPTSRQLMRHLDLVERTLRREGYAAVEALPVRVIAKALAQLEKLVWDWTPVGLAELRSRLAVMVKSRQPEAEQEAASTAALELEMATHHSPADVTEVDHAEFEEMERSWAGRMPTGPVQAATDPKG